jgi:hypothetical protein
MVRAANAEVQIDFGEVLAGVATYWRVMTGRVHTNYPRYDSNSSTVELEVLDRSPNPWQYSVTSPVYDVFGATPTYWTAHAIIKDLFSTHYGFTDPADYSLAAGGDWTLLGPCQFSQQAVALAAAQCLQPNGYRVFFDYNGDLSSALLVPAGLPAAWAVAGTIPAENIASIDGPEDTEPSATRVRVVGGETDHDLISIGDHEVLGTTRFMIVRNGLGHLTDSVTGTGDAYYVVHVGATVWETWFKSQSDDDFRDGCSDLYPIRYVAGDDTAATWTVAPHVDHVDPTSDVRHGGMERHVVNVDCTVAIGCLNIDCEYDVRAHPVAYGRQKPYCQAWSDPLIAIWGETAQEISAPLAQHWNRAKIIADQEMTIAGLSVVTAAITLKRIDLQIEPGDVWTIENPNGADFDLWIRSVSHGAGQRNAQTTIDGYVVR